MKVLFAINDDSITNAIVNKYQQKYKEIITSKNVYYFNAIIKELQRDKSYDSVVIGEDLEPISNNSYEAIDKFLFEKLDFISDEATKKGGEDIPIIFICSERRTKADQLLLKLFSIGVYDALIGADRSVNMVCSLINKPRNKKEAKKYYKIESDDIDYRQENSQEVSENEIQSILSHYKKIGSNVEKCVESFNRISEQYDDTQLRIIVKFLPIDVKAILETNSPAYQKLMIGGTVLSNGKYVKYQDSKIQNSLDFLEKDLEKTKLSEPVVIPSRIDVNKNQQINTPQFNRQPMNRMPQQPMRNNMSNMNNMQRPQNMGQMSNQFNPNINRNVNGNINSNNSFANNYTNNNVMNNQKKVDISGFNNNFVPQSVTPVVKDDKEDNSVVINTEIDEPKRGRGRPRKQLTPEEIAARENKIKRGRGRPRKNPENAVEEKPIDIQIPKEMTEKKEESIALNVVPDAKPMITEVKPIATEIAQPQNNVNRNIIQNVNTQQNNGTQNNNQQKNNVQAPNNIYSNLNPYNNIGTNPYGATMNSNPYGQSNPFDNFGSQDKFEDFDNLLEENKTNNTSNEGIEKETVDVFNDFKDVNETTNNDYQLENINNNTRENNVLIEKGKVAAFVGTTKNGTSFVVNNLALALSQNGINTAIVDLTKNKNSYYMFTNNDPRLMKVATESLKGLEKGVANGLQVNKYLTVYTALPSDFDEEGNPRNILKTVSNNYEITLLDCDFKTDSSYFVYSNEIYLIQSMDAFTIQPLTQFLSDLKTKNLLDENKLRIIINKYIKMKRLNDRMIIGGMSKYNEPSMTLQRDLFNSQTIKYMRLPFDEQTYARYLEEIAMCNLNLNGYSRNVLMGLEELRNMVYPLISGNRNSNSKRGYTASKNTTSFSSNVSDTLNKMRLNNQ